MSLCYYMSAVLSPSQRNFFVLWVVATVNTQNWSNAEKYLWSAHPHVSHLYYTSSLKAQGTLQRRQKDSENR